MPADLWHVVGGLDELRDEDGVVDDDRVRAAVDDVLRARPHWRRGGLPRRDPDQGRGRGGDAGPNAGWAALIRDRR